MAWLQRPIRNTCKLYPFHPFFTLLWLKRTLSTVPRGVIRQLKKDGMIFAFKHDKRLNNFVRYLSKHGRDMLGRLPGHSIINGL